MPVNRSMGPVEWSLLALLSILWGGAFFFVAVAVETLPPLTIVTLRIGIAAVVLYLIMWMTGIEIPAERRLWIAFAGMGLLNNVVPFCLIAWGQIYIASGLASILNATTPFFTAIVAHFLTRDEKLTAARLAGIAVAFAGVVAIVGPETLEGVDADALAQLAVLGAALSFALAAVFGRRFRDMGAAPLVTATGQLTVSTAMLVPLFLAVDRPWSLPAPGWEAGAAVAGLALLSTALAYIIYFRILATAGATNLLLATLLIPATAVLLGVAVLDERLDLQHFAGMALLACGLAVIDGRLRLRRVTGRRHGDPT